MATVGMGVVRDLRDWLSRRCEQADNQTVDSDELRVRFGVKFTLVLMSFGGIDMSC
jgi:hypothetical protein